MRIFSRGGDIGRDLSSFSSGQFVHSGTLLCLPTPATAPPPPPSLLCVCVCVCVCWGRLEGGGWRWNTVASLEWPAAAYRTYVLLVKLCDRFTFNLLPPCTQVFGDLYEGLIDTWPPSPLPLHPPLHGPVLTLFRIAPPPSTRASFFLSRSLHFLVPPPFSPPPAARSSSYSLWTRTSTLSTYPYPCPSFFVHFFASISPFVFPSLSLSLPPPPPFTPSTAARSSSHFVWDCPTPIWYISVSFPHSVRLSSFTHCIVDHHLYLSVPVSSFDLA